MTTKFDDAVKLILEAKEAYVKAMKEHGSGGVRGLCDALLESSGASAVQWRQYTPYFNDGDACEFGYYGAELGVRVSSLPDGFEPYGEGDWGDDPEDDEIENAYFAWGSGYEGKILYARRQDGTEKAQRTRYAGWGRESKPEVYYEEVPKYEYLSAPVDQSAICEFDKNMSALEDVLLAVFGDHVKVIYDGNDFKVEDYDHD